MTWSRIRPALVVLAAIGLSAGLSLQAGRGQPAAAANHVVVISLDGFPGWALDDPHLPVPTLRRLAAEGALARGGMRGVNPTVTWPTHTSMVTGVRPARHGVLFNGLLIREPGVPPRIEPWRDKSEMVRARTVYDAAHERGLTTAQVDWVAILNAPTITWEFPEQPPPTGEVAKGMVAAGLISEADLKAFATRNILWRDHMWTTAATYILREHRPNLLLFHLLNLDSTHHRYGPRTPAGMSAMALLDTQVAAIITTLEETGMSGRTTVFVVSDHGFKTVRRHIRPNAAFQKAGLLSADGPKVIKAQAYSVPEGGTAIVYVTVPDPSGAILGRARDALRGIEGIASIIEPEDFAKYGLPQPTETGQMGSLFLTASDGYAFTGAAGDTPVVDAPPTSVGSHGYLAADPDLLALFIASGRGIKQGTALDIVETIDLAPTVARLLGVSLPDVEGRVLTEILADGAP